MSFISHLVFVSTRMFGNFNQPDQFTQNHSTNQTNLLKPFNQSNQFTQPFNQSDQFTSNQTSLLDWTIPAEMWEYFFLNAMMDFLQSKQRREHKLNEGY